MNKKYIIIVVKDVESEQVEKGIRLLSDKVNKKITQGYVPIGGVSTTTSSSESNFGDYFIHLYQAMVLQS